MTDPLALIRRTIRTPADRVRWACLLEATAPKAGNVYPGVDFVDLTFSDFVLAANVVAPILGSEDQSFDCGARIRKAVSATRLACGSNVNLGMVLLLAPLVLAEFMRQRDGISLQSAVAQVVDTLTPSDSANVYEAIAMAAPGGLGDSDQMDVSDSPPVSLVEAMRVAAARDRIALQYASGFQDLFGDRLLGILSRSITATGDLFRGIQRAQIEILAEQVDSLICRKAGRSIAAEAQQRAAGVLAAADFQTAWEEYDRWLRADGHRRNPGTTADLIAAGLWCLLAP